MFVAVFCLLLIRFMLDKRDKKASKIRRHESLDSLRHSINKITNSPGPGATSINNTNRPTSLSHMTHEGSSGDLGGLGALNKTIASDLERENSN
jgi:hypothetical protein